MMRVFESVRAAAVVLFLLATLNRAVLVLTNQFDGLYGQDAYAYFFYAREFFANVTRLQSPPPFWWPLGYPALLSVGFLLGGVNAAAAQAITVLSSALVPVFAFLLTHEAANKYKIFAAWVAGLICIASGQLAQSSVVIMADAPALMFATLGAWLLLRYARTRNALTLCAAAFAVGMAAWARWQNLIFAAVWVVTLLMIEFRAAPKTISRLDARTPRMLLAIGIIALVLLPQLLIRATTNAPLAGQTWLENWSIGNFFARTFDNADGHFEYALPVAIFNAQVLAHPAYLFVMLTPLFGIGIFVLRKRTTSLLVLGWILGMYFFLAGIPYENFRFPLGLFAPVAVVTGMGAAWVWAKLSASRLRFVFVGWIGAALCVMLFWQPRVLAPVLEIKLRELQHTRWLETQLLPNALVYTMSIDGAIEMYSRIRVENLWDMDPAALDAATPTYLYADTNNIDSQWRGRLPDQLIRSLTATNELHPIASFNGWTLFRVRNCKYRVLDCE